MSPKPRRAPDDPIQPSRAAAAGRALRDAGIASLPAAVGGALFFWLALPVAWLTGGLLVSSIAAVMVPPPRLNPVIKDVAITLLGLAIGASLTPDVLTAWTKWPASLIVLVFAVTAMLAAPYAVLRWGFHWPPLTAFWASSPGALTASLALAEEGGADVKAVAAIHLTRVLVVSLLIPFIVPVPEGGHVSHVAGDFSILTLIVLFAVASATGWAFKAAAIPGGTLLGAFASTGALSASGAISFAMPPVVTAAACVVFAASIGGQFAGVRLATISELFIASLASLAAAMIASLLFAWGAAALLHLPFAKVLISYAPGGIDVLILVAYMLGADPAFVSAHQFVRLTVLVLSLPFAGRLLARWSAPDAPPPRTAPPGSGDRLRCFLSNGSSQPNADKETARRRRSGP
jgi:uncharacterized protein